jgi:hypothetical protein
MTTRRWMVVVAIVAAGLGLLAHLLRNLDRPSGVVLLALFMIFLPVGLATALARALWGHPRDWDEP